eukprot:366501-Chlamydomonas_euryale.AAC.34
MQAGRQAGMDKGILTYRQGVHKCVEASACMHHMDGRHMSTNTTCMHACKYANMYQGLPQACAWINQELPQACARIHHGL